jgi:sec-independent protein translocase protein TatB
MDFFGIGILELFFVVLIALIVLGPKDMVKAGRSLGQFLRKLMLSPGFMEAQRWVRNLPAQLMREAGIEEIQNDLRKEAARIKQETTVSVEIPTVEPPHTIAKPTPTSATPPVEEPANLSPTYPPPLTPLGQNRISANSSDTTAQAGRSIQAGSNGEGLEDIPPEWVAASAQQAGRVKIDDREDFPLEWISPPGSLNKPPIILGAHPGKPANTNEKETGQD